mmetsp:Transcript_2820/g.5452  ORF Transcript_2820/g.5452 Transcript_2820/m.5452 type:complete len:238 (+) Transcript_2820:67-780(+)|eukprot:CAMPEP_0201674914 /NCGR_PEP_ID=MMETSP0494-20130426/38304_1 /ASSEMBLY_ACC=CAM_ASM_000839 /TAXON_ID=420259 /ORGANISM="Thalassiosira gravida, Strain GMp14c1" /LENGTH=237 /DNA_ID=CAMNT_0048157189 /DNA_START=52 /DNA_END=765 /DNA_ORIENTATION=-
MADQPPPKRQRVDVAGCDDAAIKGDTVSNVPAMEARMPPCPKVPPVASTECKVKRDGGWRWASRHGMDPPKPIYGPKDTVLWPEEATDIFRATKINQDPQYASRYMRWWFENHEGMPGRVPKISRSAYSLYYAAQKGVIFHSAGKFNQKKDGKKIAAAWKVLGEEEKQPYMDKIATLRALHKANEEWWNEELEAWRDKRIVRLRSGAELDPLKRHSMGLEPLCVCSKCGPLPPALPT